MVPRSYCSSDTATSGSVAAGGGGAGDFGCPHPPVQSASRLGYLAWPQGPPQSAQSHRSGHAAAATAVATVVSIPRDPGLCHRWTQRAGDPPAQAGGCGGRILCQSQAGLQRTQTETSAGGGGGVSQCGQIGDFESADGQAGGGQCSPTWGDPAVAMGANRGRTGSVGCPWDHSAAAHRPSGGHEAGGL